MEHLSEVHRETRFALQSSAEAVWEVAFAPDGLEEQPTYEIVGTGSELAHTFTEVGTHKLRATRSGDKKLFEFTVESRVVRYEIRQLSDHDRNLYFDALHQLYVLGQEEGEKLYGSSFKSMSYLIRQHLYGAADIECDHWHDDAGILTHHIGVTWEMEQSLRMIEPKTAAHYWDYTKEAADGISWWQSDIFNDDWFGASSPANADHIVDTGRWAFTPVMTDARDFSDMTNPYGLLRSPWNTNPTPYLLRYNRTFSTFADQDSQFPTCTEFAAYVNETLGTVMAGLNGFLHGPVHIMIGGHWNQKNFWGNNRDYSWPMYGDVHLLFSKFMWRQGYVKVPELCAADVPGDECMPSCNAAAIGDKSAREVLKTTRIYGGDGWGIPLNFSLTTYTKGADSTLEQLTDEDLLEELCHVGYPGEMFTSSAPQDPTFWPLHGNAERYVQALRYYKDAGYLRNFDETWTYEHGPTPSDTHTVCDWSGVEKGSMELPTCTKGETCSGHKADDLLPFTDMEWVDGVASKLFTNAEFYEKLSPFNKNLPYVYDSVTYWDGCSGDAGDLLETARNNGYWEGNLDRDD